MKWEKTKKEAYPWLLVFAEEEEENEEEERLLDREFRHRKLPQVEQSFYNEGFLLIFSPNFTLIVNFVFNFVFFQ